MTTETRSELRRLALIAGLIAAHALAARALADWDAGDRLLGGGGQALLAGGLLLAFFALRLFVYWIVPPLVAVGALRALARRRPSRAWSDSS